MLSGISNRNTISCGTVEHFSKKILNRARNLWKLASYPAGIYTPRASCGVCTRSLLAECGSDGPQETLSSRRRCAALQRILG